MLKKHLSLLALTDLLRDISPHPHLQKLRHVLKNQLEGLNDLRDIQVMLVEVTEFPNELSEIVPFQKFLNKGERRLLLSTAKAIKSFKYSGVRKQMDTIRKRILKQKLDKVFDINMLQIVDDQFGVVLRRY